MTCCMNTYVSATTSKTPYKVVFGQAPRTNCAVLEMLSDVAVLNEQDIDDGLIECDEQPHVEVTVSPSTTEHLQVEMSENT